MLRLRGVGYLLVLRDAFGIGNDILEFRSMSSSYLDSNCIITLCLEVQVALLGLDDNKKDNLPGLVAIEALADLLSIPTVV